MEGYRPLLTTYIEAAMARAKYEQLDDDGSWIGTIPGFQGVWANTKCKVDCPLELREALEEWTVVKLRDDDAMPQVDGIDLSVKQVA